MKQNIQMSMDLSKLLITHITVVLSVMDTIQTRLPTSSSIDPVCSLPNIFSKRSIT
jgi:hypothetical protein